LTKHNGGSRLRDSPSSIWRSLRKEKAKRKPAVKAYSDTSISSPTPKTATKIRKKKKNNKKSKKQNQTLTANF